MRKYFSFLFSYIVFGVQTALLPSDFQCFAGASFTYWCAQEDGLNLAESAIAAPGGQTYLATNSEVLASNFSFQPGFQLETGFTFNDWGILGRYTWVRTDNTTQKTATSQNSVLGEESWSIDDWFLQTTLQGNSLTGSEILSHWNLGIDMADVLATCKIYNSKSVQVVSSLGLLTAWIRQKMNVYLTQNASSVGGDSFLPSQPIQSSNDSHAWGIGPEIGLHMKYLLPQSVRIEGAIATALLYTRFSNVKHHEEAASTSNVSSTGISLQKSTFYAVQPLLKTGLGAGWTSPCFLDRYRVDLSASYDFYLFWNQNAMRGLLDEAWSGQNGAVGNLYLTGLTATASFCF